jgi:hypothetical protein
MINGIKAAWALIQDYRFWSPDFGRRQDRRLTVKLPLVWFVIGIAVGGTAAFIGLPAPKAKPPQAPAAQSEGNESEGLKLRRQEAYNHNLSWHEQVEEREIRMSHFLDGNPIVTQRFAADLNRSWASGERYAYNWSIQNSYARALTMEEIDSLKSLLENRLFPPEKRPPLNGLLIISYRYEGRPVVCFCDWHDLPKEAAHLYAMSRLRGL